MLTHLTENSNDKDKVKEMVSNLAPDFRIIRHNEKPDALISGILILLGAVALLGLLIKSRIKYRPGVRADD